MQQNSSLLGRAPAGLVLMLLFVALRRLIGAGVGPCLIGSTLVTGRWMGIQNAVGNVAGMTALVVTGYLVASTGNYTSASIVSGVVALCGLVAWWPGSSSCPK